MSTRVPPSSNSPQPQSAERSAPPRRSTRAQASSDGPKKIAERPPEEAAPSAAAQLWAGQDMDRSLEIRASELEQRMGELAASDEAEKKEGHEHLAEQRDKSEKSEKKGLLKVFSWSQKQAAPKEPPKTLAQRQAEAQQAKKPAAAFGSPVPGGTSTSSPRLQPVGTGVSASRLQAVQKAMLGGQSATNERPPDAFALLKDARDKGVLFVEDALKEGHSEEQEDPELAAAVEACIAQCFGVRGILRIGPGHNEKHEPIIVVVTTNGFTDASLAKVPEKVHRFATLIAIPFDLLPLKRER